MNQATYHAIEQYMLDTMNDTAHDPMHIYRVLYSALDIASTEPQANADVVIAAALLHDVGRPKQAENPELDHAAEGAPMAKSFLMQIGWPESMANHVADCVRTHRYRRGDAPSTLEARIIFDADKLDACGVLGISRTLAYGAQVTEPLYILDAHKQIITEGGGAEISSFFQEYNWKLRGIYGKMLTVRGKALAQRRRDAAYQFYDALEREINECHSYDAALMSHLSKP